MNEKLNCFLQERICGGDDEKDEFTAFHVSFSQKKNSSLHFTWKEKEQENASHLKVMKEIKNEANHNLPKLFNIFSSLSNLYFQLENPFLPLPDYIAHLDISKNVRDKRNGEKELMEILEHLPERLLSLRLDGNIIESFPKPLPPFLTTLSVENCGLSNKGLQQCLQIKTLRSLNIEDQFHHADEGVFPDEVFCRFLVHPNCKLKMLQTTFSLTISFFDALKKNTSLTFLRAPNFPNISKEIFQDIMKRNVKFQRGKLAFLFFYGNSSTPLFQRIALLIS
jgi:hypothetical protein